MVEIWEGGETSLYEKPAFTPWIAPGVGMPNIGGGGEEVDPYDAVDDYGNVPATVNAPFVGSPGYDYQTVTDPPEIPWNVIKPEVLPEAGPYVDKEAGPYVDEGGWTPPSVGGWQPPTIGGGLDLTPGAGTGLPFVGGFETPDLSLPAWTPPDLSVGDVTKPFDMGKDFLQMMMLMMVMKD